MPRSRKTAGRGEGDRHDGRSDGAALHYYTTTTSSKLEEEEGTFPHFGSAFVVVPVTDRAKVGWNVSSRVYDTHRDWAADEPYDSHARAIEAAMRAFIDDDKAAEIERELVDIIDQLPGGFTRHSDDGEKKTPPNEYDSHPAGGPTREVNNRIASDLKAEFARIAREKFDTRPGMALSHALFEHHGTGGRNRHQRCMDNLGIVRRYVEADATTKPRDKIDAITDQLGDEFRLSDFVDAAESVGVSTKKYAVEKYLPRVIDKTDTVPHPGNPRVFIPTSSPTAPECPNPANLPYYMMTDDDKRVGIHVAAVRKAWSSNGDRTKFTVGEGVDALSGEGSPRHKTVRAAMRDVGKYRGFDYDDDSVLKIKQDDIDTAELDEILAIAAEERARENEGDAGDSSDDRATRGEAVNADEGEADSIREAAADRMEMLEAGTTTVTDGGGS